MATKKSVDTDWTVATQAEVGRFFGIALQTVKLWAKEGMPGQRGYYDLSLIYKWLKARENADASSDALEMQRLEKAKILRLDRLQKERQLVSLEALHSFLTSFARHMRELGEQLQREYGAEVGRLFNEHIDAAINDLDRAGRDYDSGEMDFGGDDSSEVHAASV